MLEELKTMYTKDSIYNLNNIINNIKEKFNVEVIQEDYHLTLKDNKKMYSIDFNKIDDENILIEDIYELFKEMSLGKNYHK